MEVAVLTTLLSIFRRDGEVSLSIRTHPHAKKTQIKGVMSDGSLKIDVAAPADDGKANAELVAFLADEFDVASTHVELVSGQTSRRKVIRIRSARS